MSNNKQNPVRFAIRINDNPVPNDCPICDKQTNPNIGAEIFVDGTEQIVCFDCALLNCPLLASIINLADAARFFAQYEEENNSIWEAVRAAEDKKNKGGLLRFPKQGRRSA
jgi:hypothetical protein